MRWVLLFILPFLVLGGTGCNSSPPAQKDPPPSQNQGGERKAEKVEVEIFVTDSAGRPIQGAQVHPEPLFKPKNPLPEKSIHTNEKGFASLHLEPGPYNIVIRMDGQIVAKKKVQVEQDMQVRFKIKKQP